MRVLLVLIFMHFQYFFCGLRVYHGFSASRLLCYEKPLPSLWRSLQSFAVFLEVLCDFLQCLVVLVVFMLRNWSH